MTKEEIIEIARQSGFTRHWEYEKCLVCNPDSLYHFAKLIAEKEREEFWNRIESKGDWTEYEKQMIEKAILKERERIKEQNALEIEKINAYIKQLEDKLKELE